MISSCLDDRCGDRGGVDPAGVAVAVDRDGSGRGGGVSGRRSAGGIEDGQPTVDGQQEGAAHLGGYKPYLDKIAEGTKAYGMPVLMIMGDSHTYRSDNPLMKGAPCAVEVESGKTAVACSDSRAEAMLAERKSPTDAYGTQPHGYNVPNFHRIVVHGETMPLEWLKLRIDPTANHTHGLDAFGPFSWERAQPRM